MIITHPSELGILPRKIISLVPSQTELFHSLGLEEEIIGITKFCVHPKQWSDNKTKIGGTKNLNIEKINQLNPDLIVANKEENTKEQILLLAEKHPIWVTDVYDYRGALEMIKDMGLITHKETAAQAIIQQIQEAFSAIHPIKSYNNKVVYLIWKQPYMTIGQDTFISDLLQKTGLVNCFHHLKRYPIITLEEIERQSPNYIFLSSEPYPFIEKDIQAIKEQLPNCNILLVDGEMFSWYGSRLTQSASYFSKLILKITK